MNSFRQMRLKERELPKEEAENILKKGSYGVLALYGSDGYPYGVPVNYAYKNGVIYVHHTTGESLLSDDILNNCKVSFTVVSKSEVIAEKFTDAYESVIAFGTAKITDDIYRGMMQIAEKYSPGMKAETAQRIDKAAGRAFIVEVKVEHISGKHRPEI